MFIQSRKLCECINNVENLLFRRQIEISTANWLGIGRSFVYLHPVNNCEISSYFNAFLLKIKSDRFDVALLKIECSHLVTHSIWRVGKQKAKKAITILYGPHKSVSNCSNGQQLKALLLNPWKRSNGKRLNRTIFVSIVIFKSFFKIFK